MPVPACCARLGQAACVSPHLLMTKPIIEQVNTHGVVHWVVTQGGTVRHFQHDWKARWYYEACMRYYRTKVLGRGS